MKRFASILNGNIMNTPFKYLGLYKGGDDRKVWFWKEIVEKIRKSSRDGNGDTYIFHVEYPFSKYFITLLLLFYMSFFQNAKGNEKINQEDTNTISLGMGMGRGW